MKKKTYLTSQELAAALIESQEKKEPTVEVCNYFKLIAKHLLGHSRYCRYPKDVQDELVSSALLKCIKNIKNFKREYASKCFNYFTRTVEHAFWEYLSKMYKQRNIQRQLAYDTASKLEETNPFEARAIRSMLLPEDTTYAL